MIRQLLSLEWKSFLRSASFGKNVAMKILLIFLAVYFGLSFLIIGIGLYPILEDLNNDMSPMSFVNSFILWWWLSELLIRYMLQNLSTTNLKPLLVQNIKKAFLTKFLLGKSLLSIFNAFSALIFIPFGIMCMIKGDYSVLAIVGWWLSLFSLVLIAHFLNIYLNKINRRSYKSLVLIISIGLALFLLNYFDLVDVVRYSAYLMEQVLMYPWLSFLFIVVLFLVIRLCYRTLYQSLYLDAAMHHTENKVAGAELKWLSLFGKYAMFLKLDMKLIWRNKRPRTSLIFCIFIIAYGFLLRSTWDFDIAWVFIGIFITGIFMINFGQFIPAWDSSYFSMLMTQRFSMFNYIKSKQLLILFSIFVMLVLSSIYLMLGWRIYVIFVATAIFNAGINTPIILYAGYASRKKIDLDKSQFMNYQGTGAAQWIISIPILFLPMIIAAITYYVFNYTVMVASLSSLGILGLVFSNRIYKYIADVYTKHKYKMIQGFKEVQ